MKKELIGKIIKIIDENTIKVIVNRTLVHPMFNKRIKRSKKYLVNVNTTKFNNLKLNDSVKIEISRKFSKNKYFRLKEILNK